MTEITEGWLMKEFTARAKACQLSADCLGSGKLDSEIVIISEAPGVQEVSQAMPLVAGAGKHLWSALRSVGVTRKDCYTTFVVKKQVVLGSDPKDKNPVKKSEIEHWEGLLDWELDCLPNVKYIICLGNLSLHAITGEYGISNWRGSVVDCLVGRKRKLVKMLCTNNPSHILRNLAMVPMFNFDINKLKRVIDGTFKKHEVKGLINPTFDEAMEAIQQVEDDEAPISIDIEIIANETACIGFANNAYTGTCINFRDGSSNRYSVEEECLLRKRLQRLFHNPEKRFIAQNGSFDCGWLGYKDRIDVPKIWFDTLLAHHTLYPRMPHNLGYLTAQYTDHPYYKDEGKTWREGGNINQFWDYNIKDCCITWAVHAAINKELKAQKLSTFFFNHVMRLQPHLVQMQIGGIKADIILKDIIAADLKIELEEMLDEFHKQVRNVTGDESFTPNPKSPKQLKDLFFNYLGLVGRGSSTNKDNRQRMLDNPKTTEEQKSILKLLNKYLTEQKFYSTYAQQKVDPDGRLRCEYKQFGVQSAPGRLSSSGVMWGSGMNLQNQPHRAYPMFVCDEGYMLSYFDLRQAEAKVVAYLWNVEGLIENFIKAETEEGFDVHRGNASRIFQVPYDEIPATDWDENLLPTRRYLGKRCVHGLNYRMQAPKLAEVCNIPMQQAFEAFASYHRAFPEIQRGWTDTINTVREERQLFSPLGRRLIWLEALDENSFDSIIAFKPQSTIGDKVSAVIYECEEDNEWPTEARMLLNVHDALIAIHKPEDKDVVQRVMKKHAEAPIIIRGTPVSIGTDFNQSMPGEDGVHRWSTLKEV